MSNLTERCRIVFCHADRDLYAVLRSDSAKQSGCSYLPQASQLSDDSIVGIEDLGEWKRLALDERGAERCRNLASGVQLYMRLNVHELCSYEIGLRIADSLGITKTGSAGDKKVTEIQRENV